MAKRVRMAEFSPVHGRAAGDRRLDEQWHKIVGTLEKVMKRESVTHEDAMQAMTAVQEYCVGTVGILSKPLAGTRSRFSVTSGMGSGRNVRRCSPSRAAVASSDVGCAPEPFLVGRRASCSRQRII